MVGADDSFERVLVILQLVLSKTSENVSGDDFLYKCQVWLLGGVCDCLLKLIIDLSLFGKSYKQFSVFGLVKRF